MTTLSSSRVIKRTGSSQGSTVEPYLPPVELIRSSRQRDPERAIFPRVNKDGVPVDEMGVPQAVGEGALLDETGEGESLMEDSVDEAAKILEEVRRAAQQDAEEFLEAERKRAQEEAAQAREAGYRAGYETGYEEGRRKADGEYRREFEQRLLAFQEDVERALQAVELAKERCLHNYIDELKDCAIAIGEKVIQISLRSSGEVMKQMIITATEKLKKTAWVKIYIDKADYDMMMEADADIIDELSHLSDNIKFIVMDKEDTGSCIIEMPEEIVDVSVNTQMENIRDILENVRI